MSYNDPDIKRDIRDAAERVLDRVGPWVGKWMAFAWAGALGAAVAFDIGRSLYQVLPSGITWADVPSIVTPRVAVAVVFALVCFYVYANWAMSLAQRVERYLKGRGFW